MGLFSKNLVRNSNMRPEIQTVTVDELIGLEAELASYNLKTVKYEDLDRLTLKKVLRKYS